MSQQQPQPRRVGRRVHRVHRRRRLRAHLRAAVAGAVALVLAAAALAVAARWLAVDASPGDEPAATAPTSASAREGSAPPAPADTSTSDADGPRSEPTAHDRGAAPPGATRHEGAAPTDDPGATATATRYRVRPGDTASGIAWLHAVEVGALAAANGLRPPYDLTPGQWLDVPFPHGEADDPPTTHPPHDAAVRSAIDRWAAAHDLPAALLAAVLWRESSWDPAARSDVGAIGVGQLMPGTARWVADELIGASLDPSIVEDNVQLSARLLRFLIDDADGDQAAALAAYYQGPAATERDGWYAETDRYVASVFELRWRFAADMGGPVT